MAKPTQEQLKQALAAAASMREQGKDPDFVAKSLLSLEYRHREWQKVISLLKLYLHSGQGSTEHAKLVKALEAAEKIENDTRDDLNFGLD